jgi:regulator of protease activity HflC (stomatin/prohibitin superfamily)
MNDTLPVALLVIAFLLFVFISLNMRLVKEHTVGIIERMGRFDRLASPGIHFLVPFVDRMVATVPTDTQERVIDGTVIRYKIVQPEAYYDADDALITSTLLCLSDSSSLPCDDEAETYGIKIMSVTNDNRR